VQHSRAHVIRQINRANTDALYKLLPAAQLAEGTSEVGQSAEPLAAAPEPEQPDAMPAAVETLPPALAESEPKEDAKPADEPLEETEEPEEPLRRAIELPIEPVKRYAASALVVAAAAASASATAEAAPPESATGEHSSPTLSSAGDGGAGAAPQKPAEEGHEASVGAMLEPSDDPPARHDASAEAFWRPSGHQQARVWLLSLSRACFAAAK